MALVIAASAVLSFSSLVLGGYSAAPGDYSIDGGPPVHALAHGHIAALLKPHPWVGPFSIVFRAPFAAIAGVLHLSEYRWGTLPCLLAAGLVGLFLARFARRRGAPLAAQVMLVALTIANPTTWAALQSGHPEEILTAALAVGAVAAASDGRSLWAAVLLGLAVASKQWALIAVLPVLMALTRDRLRVAVVAAAIAALLTLPAVLAHPGGYEATQSDAASTHGFVDSWSVWYPVAASTPGMVAGGPNWPSAHPSAGGSALIGRLSRPLIVLVAVALPLALTLRRRRFGLPGSDAMALLALLALLRCVLDPIDNIYYHVPLLLALAGWDALCGRGLPIRVALGAAFALLLWRWSVVLDPHAFNAAYLAVALPAGLAIGISLWLPREAGRPLLAVSRRWSARTLRAG